MGLNVSAPLHEPPWGISSRYATVTVVWPSTARPIVSDQHPSPSFWGLLVTFS
jgi:hypothetical protein